MSKYAPFSKKQVAYIRKSGSCWLNIAEGGKRAGKNIINIIAFSMNIELSPDKIHLAAGVTHGTARMNIIDSNGFGLKNYFNGRCRAGVYEGVEALFVKTATGDKVVLIAGGQKINDAARIKGFSLGCVYITEANECHKTFIQECFDRTAAAQRRRVFMDLNPKPPRHWFYQDIESVHKENQSKDPNYGYNYQHFTIADNLSIDDDRLRQIISTYNQKSQWFKADILGKRTTASGIIYTGFSKAIEIDQKEIVEKLPDGTYDRKISFTDFSVGVDVGGTDATVATLNGFTSGYQQVIAIDGYYHKQGIEHGMDHAQYAAAIASFIKRWTEVYPKLKNCNVFCESADKLFRQALRNALDKEDLRMMNIVPSYKKDGIVDRIHLQEILINQGRKRIASHMKQWLDAYEQACWDEKEYLEKDWVRVDDGSYPVDCLDSDEYSIQPFKPMLINAA